MRIKQFAQFFQGYMSVASIVAASLPLPLAAFHVIPTYAAQTKHFSVYTSLFCFLLLAFIFYSRHSFARWMFRDVRNVQVRLLPLLLIFVSLGSAFGYHAALTASVQEVEQAWIAGGVPDYSTSVILEKTDTLHIPHSTALFVLYLLIFLSAEAAFIVMALREYLQDVMGLDDLKLISG